MRPERAAAADVAGERSAGPGADGRVVPGRAVPEHDDADGVEGDFDEGVLIGYRYYDANGQAPLFPFGYGLSYTTLRATDRCDRRARRRTFTASVRVTNTGSKAGAEVPQLYLKYPGAAGEAPWSLKGFDKVILSPGESQIVTFPLNATTSAATATARTHGSACRAGSSSPSAARRATCAISSPSTRHSLATARPSHRDGRRHRARDALADARRGRQFGAFTPGVAKDYTASTTANVISTAGDAALTVSDPGHLMNGTFALPSPLRGVAVARRRGAAPVSNDPVTITFKQHIGATDALRTGTYSKTLTFTLSTTTP